MSWYHDDCIIFLTNNNLHADSGGYRWLEWSFLHSRTRTLWAASATQDLDGAPDQTVAIDNSKASCDHITISIVPAKVCSCAIFPSKLGYSTCKLSRSRYHSSGRYGWDVVCLISICTSTRVKAHGDTAAIMDVLRQWLDITRQPVPLSEPWDTLNTPCMAYNGNSSSRRSTGVSHVQGAHAPILEY